MCVQRCGARSVSSRARCQSILPNPGFNCVAHFAKAAFEEMVGTVDDHQLLGFSKRIYQSLELRPRTKLVAAAANEEFRFAAVAQTRQIVGAFLNGLNRNTEANGSDDAVVLAGGLQSNGGTKRKSGEDQRPAELAIEPIESGTNVVSFTLSVVVLALAESGSAKIEAEHGKTKTIQGLHRVKDNLVVQGAAINRMRMAHNCGVSRIVGAEIQNGLKPSGWAVEEKRTNCAGSGVHRIRLPQRLPARSSMGKATGSSNLAIVAAFAGGRAHRVPIVGVKNFDRAIHVVELNVCAAATKLTTHVVSNDPMVAHVE